MSFQALLERIGDGEDAFEDDFLHDLYSQIVHRARPNHSPNLLEKAYTEMLNMHVPKEHICLEFIKHETPFSLVVGLGDLELAKIMISKGVDVNMLMDGNYLPLHTACYRGDVEMAELLLQKGADITYHDGGGQSPLLALFEGMSSDNIEWITVDDCYRMTRLLVSYGAKLNKTSSYDMQAILDAIKYANLDTVKLLVNEANGDLNFRLHRGDSCLHAAAVSIEPGVLEYVLGVFKKENMDLNVVDYRLETPLMWASYPNFPNNTAIKMLLKSGADFRLKNEKGLTSFDLLMKSERNPEIAWLYFDLGLELLGGEETLLERAVKSESPWVPDIIAEIAKKKMMDAGIVGKSQKVFNQHRAARYWRGLCKEQLRQMQRIKFYENVSFWDVLTADQNKLTEYAENSELLKAFFTTKCDGVFPFYCTRIRLKFFEIMSRNRLIDVSSYVVCEAIKRPTMYEIMQHEILTYIKDDDFFELLAYCLKP